MAKYEITCDRTIFYSIEIEAETPEQAWQIASKTPIHEWNDNNTEGTMCDLQDVVKLNG